ncbi:MAG: type II toxin-antitoxin system HicB family antitoxin [Leptolyngbyaceae cyanobacterium SM1_4_3]|nr:type II toxin-antitoxin system HicB family antitoxin [Leptolyngbyaceae cyanobacterium SM1_4_3]NJN92480.1 type II toxin-antitoxin system HicB family antitoxin [Leptolyngbyaceae cyanobacterium SL_5_14]
MNRFQFPVVIEKDEEGYFASCPTLQGCYTQGDSYEEALQNIQDAILLHIEDRIANGEEVPKFSQMSLTTVEVQV